MKNRPYAALAFSVSFAALLVVLWFVGSYFHVTTQLGSSALAAFVSVALLIAPYWAFGFGLAYPLQRKLITPASRVLAASSLSIPYLVFASLTGRYSWPILLSMLGALLLIAVLLEAARSRPPGWLDWLVLILLAVAVELHLFDRAWPLPGLTAVPKLLFVDLALYGYLVVRPIEGIGYDFMPRSVDLTVGLREFLFFVPIALALGCVTGFLHLHATLPKPLAFAAGWLFTILFIAVPEELFFRGLLLNMLQRRIGKYRALLISSVLFGLAHFNKRAASFNWRYVILAAIAGVFYGRAWLSRRRILTSSVTHATVDTVWSIWLR